MYFYKKLFLIETLLVTLKHEKARKLLQEPEYLDILEVKEQYKEQRPGDIENTDLKIQFL